MKKNFVRNLVLKTLLYAFIISALPYCYFLWHAKQGVDAYLVTRNFEAKLDYSWLWINQDGVIYLEDVQVFKNKRKPIIQAPRLKISLPSIFDLLDSREQVVYKTYPSQISLSVVNATTNQPIQAFNLFGINYQKQQNSLIFPDECLQKNKANLPNLYFDLSTNFQIEQTADIASVSFKFSDSQLATVKGKLNINRLFETGANTTYLSDIKLNISEIAWLQHNTQKCIEALTLGRNKLTIFYTNFIQQQATNNNLVINKNALADISDFFYSPQTIDIDLNIKEGFTYSQIDFDPIWSFQERVGLAIKLNNEDIGQVFSYTEDDAEETQRLENTTSEEPKKAGQQEMIKGHFISKSKQSLTQYLGSKIKVNLYNGGPHIGYLDSISRNQLILKKLEYKGKSTLPFNYNEIKSLELLVAEN